MFALAMLRLEGRRSRQPRRSRQAAGVLGQARQSEGGLQSGAALPRRPDLAARPQTRRGIAPRRRRCRQPEAQYALATFYKEGTGVPKDLEKAVRLLQAASLADNVDAEVEYAIALYNGTGTPKNEAAAWRCCARPPDKTVRSPEPLAHVLLSGRGAPMDKVEASNGIWSPKASARATPCSTRRSQTSVRRIAPRPRRPRANGSRQMMRLDATATAGHPVRGAMLASGCRLTFPRRGEEARFHCRNVHRKRDHAAFSPHQRHGQSRAPRGRSLKRDLGEVENLQVSLKVPPISSPWPTAAPRRCCTPISPRRVRVTASSAKKAHPRRRGQEPYWIVDPLDGTTNFLHGIRNSRFRWPAARGHHHRGPDLQSGQ